MGLPLERDRVCCGAGIETASNCIGRWWCTAVTRPVVVRPRLRSGSAVRRSVVRVSVRPRAMVVVAILLVEKGFGYETSMDSEIKAIRSNPLQVDGGWRVGCKRGCVIGNGDVIARV